MVNKIIRIEPVPEHFSITWMLGARCNYDCMYCAPEWHDNTSAPPDIETLITAWNNVYQPAQAKGLKFKISFTGGEVTANKSFLPFVEWLTTHNDIDQICVTSNGSASLNYYTRLSTLVTNLSFSTHSEFMNEQEFFDKAQALHKLMPRPSKIFHVNVMDEYWNQARTEKYCAWLEQQGISHSVNRINYQYKTRDNVVMKGVQDHERFGS